MKLEYKIYLLSFLLVLVNISATNARGLGHKHARSAVSIAPKKNKELEKHMLSDSCARDPQKCSGNNAVKTSASENKAPSTHEAELIKVP
ncbi:hypothetical protein QM565_32725 [Geitlerinema splendidum]|jgi:hypothetical protein|nr:hypothetical protein [Geitlerinema splendidum]